MLSPQGSRTFFDPADFRWIAHLEAQWTVIRGELDRLMPRLEQIPNFADVSPEQEILAQGSEWKSLFFYGYGHRAEHNCRRCPETAQLLQTIPGMRTAMFSILAPGKRLPEHRGPYNGVLRYHLALIVPEPRESCGIRVGTDVRHWEEGKSLVFDDSHLHEAWNETNAHRVVLFVDFERPLYFPLSAINRRMIQRIAESPMVIESMERIRRAPPPGDIG
jgi:beta-hydroxylase